MSRQSLNTTLADPESTEISILPDEPARDLGSKTELVKPRIEPSSESETFGRFVIEPLESGFGLTLGNALRRVLLSSLPGVATTWVKINGVQHEFSTIESIKEDTTEFILNVKSIRFRALSDRPGTLTLDVSGEREVTAADIVETADFETVNRDLHLATLGSKTAGLTVEFNIEHGRGYQPAGSAADLGIGVIPVDAIFTPVRKVNYLVETTRIGVDNYDRLIIEMWTDGTIAPPDALSKASAILVDQFAAIANVGEIRTAAVDKAPLSPISMPQKQYDTPIEELDLSVRSYNCLKRAGITKVGQIVDMTEEDLLNVRNFGGKSLDELRDRLEVRGFIVGGRERSANEALGAVSVEMSDGDTSDAGYLSFEPDEIAD